METLDRLSRRVCVAGLWFGGALVLIAAVVIGIDVLMRKFLASSIGGADEIAGYALAIGTVWGLGAALIDRAHIRIDSLYVNFPIGLRVALDLAGLALFVGFFAMIAWHGWGVVEQSWVAGSRSQSAISGPVSSAYTRADARFDATTTAAGTLIVATPPTSRRSWSRPGRP